MGGFLNYEAYWSLTEDKHASGARDGEARAIGTSRGEYYKNSLCRRCTWTSD